MRIFQITPDMMDESNFHLNPEAKEFVPTTLTSPASPPVAAEPAPEPQQANGELDTLQVKQPYRHVFDDVVSQSPRKGRESNMDDFLLPAENDFDVEIANRPHELLDDDVKMPEGEVEEPAIELQNENELFLIQNPLDNVGMKDSLYVENTSSGFNNGEVDLLNTIQPLPTEVEIEENNVLSNKEGLSLEIEEKDIISPSSDDIKEIVTEIEELVLEMHIDESPEEPQAVLLEALPIDISQPEVETEVAQNAMDFLQSEPEVLLEVSQPAQFDDVVMEEIKPIEEMKPDEPVIEEKTSDEPVIVVEPPVTNGDINVEELNKKNLEESAKLDAPAKIEESKLLEATLGAVAVTAAVTATIKASSAKKSPASKPAATKKPTTTTTAKKIGATTASSLAASRPKTAPVKSTTERKPISAASRTTTVTAAKPRVDIKKTTTTSTLSKPKEVTKTTEIKRTTTTTASTK